MQIFFYNPDDFDSFQTAISENRIIGAMAVFFQVSYQWPKDFNRRVLSVFFAIPRVVLCLMNASVF